MIRIACILLSVLIHYYAIAQSIDDSVVANIASNTRYAVEFKTSLIKTPFRLNHYKESISNKMVRGTLYVSAYNITMGTYLLIAPEYVSKWNKKEKFKMESIVSQYKNSFSQPPVIDHDLWIVNYIGHPYQGSFYYNSIRAQDATFWQSSFFCMGQSLLWEFVWEGGMEQPSIQDLISTPLAGILVGELTHEATIKMSRNGFKWYEIALICLINPAYAINNGFRRDRNHELHKYH